MDIAAVPVSGALDAAALDLLFREARTYNAFLDTPVSDETLNTLVELAEFGPTAANSVPYRVAFVRSEEAKAKLSPHLSEGNRAKTLAAPVTAILAYDLAFPDTMARTFPHAPGAKDWFQGPAIEASAAMNGALQAGYFIIAARALGLDAGPMGGFDKEGVNTAFFAGGTWRSLLLVNLGYGDRTRLHPRNPRLPVDEISRIL
ncbi:malonic semialdehyde reductase [Chthonobacter albigriseus]|uniref:malonic semialdehyde reductase n=1 Tax=Chthonobacter albigriseus TaxID=1683161 RepID=UPI0015EFCE38|nr:malonic semialdehyde reductase [Chthonobacter albigriseus]